ncbi:10415_t:CDS:2, partial [Acaulospora morrowiae]
QLNSYIPQRNIQPSPSLQIRKKEGIYSLQLIDFHNLEFNTINENVPFIAASYGDIVPSTEVNREKMVTRDHAIRPSQQIDIYFDTALKCTTFRDVKRWSIFIWKIDGKTRQVRANLAPIFKFVLASKLTNHVHSIIMNASYSWETLMQCSFSHIIFDIALMHQLTIGVLIIYIAACRIKDPQGIGTFKDEVEAPQWFHRFECYHFGVGYPLIWMATSECESIYRRYPNISRI